jgi:hypothetical protein
LVIIAGPSGSGKTQLLKQIGDQLNLPVINLNLKMSEKLLSLTRRQRRLKAEEIAMHGMQLGAVGMVNQLRTWTEEGFLPKLINLLRARGFDIFISADHGNMEAVGFGRPKDGVLSEMRGERCRIYPDAVLRKACLTAFPDTIAWDNLGLPGDLSVILAPYGRAFTQNRGTLVCHGGAALEEVCVPFIRIRNQG